MRRHWCYRVNSTRHATPLTVIGGFLGAGKTTLLNRVLTQSTGVRYGVLVNDFGALAIDGDLVVEHGGDTITFANGCVCCTLGDSLMDAVDQLLDSPSAPQQFLVEASGVADPQGIVDLAVLHPHLQQDLTVVLVDAQTIRLRADDERLRDTVHRQLKAADLMVLNKTDLVTEEDCASTRAWLAGFSAAPVVLAVNAALPLDVLSAQPLVHREPCNTNIGGRYLAPLHEPGHLFRSVTVPMPDAVDVVSLTQCLVALTPGLLRAKGFVRSLDDPTGRCLVDLSGQRVTVRQWQVTRDEALPEPAIVLIGLSQLPDASSLARLVTGYGAASN